jgi:hypothetical protein
MCSVTPYDRADDEPATCTPNGLSASPPSRFPGVERERVLAQVMFTDHCVARYVARVNGAPQRSPRRARWHLTRLVRERARLSASAPRSFAQQRRGARWFVIVDMPDDQLVMPLIPRDAVRDG